MTEQDNLKSIMERREALRGQESAIYNHINSLISKYQEMLANDRAPEDERKDLLYQIIDSIKALLDSESPFGESSFLDDDKKTKLKNLNLFIYGIIRGLVNSEEQNNFFRSAGWGDLIGEVVDEDEQTVTGGANIPAAGGGGPPEDPPRGGMPANDRENGENPESADEWIRKKRLEIDDVEEGIEVDLESIGIRMGQKHNKDEEITNSYNAGIRQISLDIKRRKRLYPSDAVTYDNFALEIEERKKRFFDVWNVVIDKNKEILNVEKMTLREIADYILENEFDFWSGQHNQSNDENERNTIEALHQRLWKNPHWVTGFSRDEVVGEPGLKYADLEVREIVGDLQILGLFAFMNARGLESGRIDDMAAEGLLPELENALAKLRIQKEQINLVTFAHPRTGMVLYEVLRRMKDQASLNKGKNPTLSRGNSPENLGRPLINDRIIERGGVKMLLYGDGIRKQYDSSGREIGEGFVEAQKLKPGDRVIFDYEDTANGFIRAAVHDRVVKRNGVDTLLVGDTMIRMIDKKGFEVGYKWYEREEELPGDEKLYEYDSRFCYETLSGPAGQPTLKEYATQMMRLVEEQRLEEKLAAEENREPNPDKIYFKDLVGFQLPDPNTELGGSDISRLIMQSRFIYFSFPFLSEALATRQRRTLTPAHGFANKDIPYTFLLDTEGFIVQKGERYGGADLAWYYLLKFFQPPKERQRGAGGEARRLGAVRNLIIKYDAIFDDDDTTVGFIPELPYGSKIFHTALSMAALEPGATSSLKGKAKLYDGTEIVGTFENPAYFGLGGKQKNSAQEPYPYQLVFTSMRAFEKILTTAVSGLPDKLNRAIIAEGVADKESIMKKMYGTDMGQAKMSSTKTKEKLEVPDLRNFDHMYVCSRIMWYMVKRVFQKYPADNVVDRINLYKAIEKAFMQASQGGGLSAGSAREVLTFVLSQMSKPDKHGKLYGVGVVEGFDGMNPCLSPIEPTLLGEKGAEVFEYLEDHWNYKHMDADGNVTSPFPFARPVGDSKLGYVSINPALKFRQVLAPDPDVALYESYLKGWKINEKGERVKVHLPEPIERIVTEKHGDK